MAHVVLAECAGRAWLVRGEEHIDDLLNNSLPPDVSIEVKLCESKLVVDALWRQWNGEDDPAAMWMIHPNILARVRGAGALLGGPNHIKVQFAEWSAAVDDAGDRAVQQAATALRALDDGQIALVSYLAADAAAMAAGMADLRCGMLETKLAALGVTRVARETRVAETDEQRLLVELIIST